SPHGSTSGKVQGTSGKDTATRTVRVGEIDRPVLDAGLHIPLAAFGNGTEVVASEQRGYPGGAWEFVVTAVGSLDDAGLLGRRYMVVGCPAKSYATARRLDVVEVPS
ncbi:MAG TPA: DUF6093 family protein, partial [Actinomycetales bacterium]|nr:DUF6093 family protein [Actinomycetales bacterium]